MGRDRNDRGRYADGIDPDTVIDVFDAREDTSRPVTAGDVVEELGIARRTAHNKLNALVERGVLETRKIGARGRVWWTPNPRRQETPEDAVADAVEGLQGSGADYDRRRDAVRKMYDHLRECEGERLSKSDFATLLDGADVGYDGGFQSLWSNWVKASSDHPNTLAELSGVERRGDHYVFEGDT